VTLEAGRSDTLQVRLTFNYARKGGYSYGSEDYRWAILRERVNNRFLFFVFNIVFIAFTQSLLLCIVTAPTYLFVVLAQLPEEVKFGLPDLIFSRLLIFYILLEIVADEQQWRYQQAKKKYQNEGVIAEGYEKEDLERGFVVSGLWSYSRHPNFAAEQAIWLTLYAWASYSTKTYINWAGIGAFGYWALFQGSTWLTEKLSAGKYPEYREYQARVGRFIPRWSTKARGISGVTTDDKTVAAKDASKAKKKN
jgi:steroid 5-alpha reductase family enzyme